MTLVHQSMIAVLDWGLSNQHASMATMQTRHAGIAMFRKARRQVHC